jgi:hypothetical protein
MVYSYFKDMRGPGGRSTDFQARISKFQRRGFSSSPTAHQTILVR